MAVTLAFLALFSSLGARAHEFDHGKDLRRAYWAGPAGEFTAADVWNGVAPLGPASGDTVFSLGQGRELWLRVGLPPSAAARSFIVEFPMAALDLVTVHQRSADGGWTSQTAGDALPLSRWPFPGRYPAFKLGPLPGSSPEFLIQVHHARPVALPMRLETASSHYRHAQLEHVVIGVVVGSLALLLASALFKAVAGRDSAYLLLAGYTFSAALAAAAMTGVGSSLLWGEFPWVSDTAPGALTLVSASLAAFLCANLGAAASRTPKFGQALRAVGWMGLMLFVAYSFLDRSDGAVVLGAYLMLVSVLNLAAGIRTRWRGDVVGSWMLAGSLPLVGGVLVAVARLFDWIEASVATEYVAPAALMLGLPMILGALNRRSRERRSTQRAQRAAEHFDLATGLPKAKTFYARALQALRRYRASGEPAAIVLVDLSNYVQIESGAGSEAAEDALLRAATKLRSLLQDTDTVARVGQARFGVLLDGPASRESVTDFATGLIARGLMLEAGITPQIPLHFQLVCTLISEYAPAADTLLQEMSLQLSAMPPRARRPIRFVDGSSRAEPEVRAPAQVAAVDTQPIPLV